MTKIPDGFLAYPRFWKAKKRNTFNTYITKANAMKKVFFVALSSVAFIKQIIVGI